MRFMIQWTGVLMDVGAEGGRHARSLGSAAASWECERDEGGGRIRFRAQRISRDQEEARISSNRSRDALDLEVWGQLCRVPVSSGKQIAGG